MHKKILIILMVVTFAIGYGIPAAYSSMWSSWADEDEEMNIKQTSKKSRNYNSSNNFKKDDSSWSFSEFFSLGSDDDKNNAPLKYTNMNNNSFEMDMITNSKPIVLCRQKGCTQLNDKMTRSYLFNSIANLLFVNNKTKVYLCEADVNTRACKSNGLKYAVNIGGTAGVIHIPSLTITDVSFSQNLKRINFMFSYDLYANGLKSFCSSAYNTIEISENKQALIRDNNYKCQLTSDLPSTSYNIYNIDYVDLDYGIIGAYYSTGMSGASSGGNDGYVLMKFQYTDKNLAQPINGCNNGECQKEDYTIPPGQYEIIPIKN